MLNFVRSGNVYLQNSSIRGPGEDGDGWSNIAENYAGPSAGSTSALYLYFNDSSVGTTTNYYRWRGFPVRIDVTGYVSCRHL